MGIIAAFTLRLDSQDYFTGGVASIVSVENSNVQMKGETNMKSVKLDTPQRWRHDFQVSGSGYFPFDMLRYDQCCFVYERDSTMLAYNAMGQWGNITINLVSYSVSKDWTPTVAKWESFGWKVL